MRIVVVGYGMAGARFTDELLATGSDCDITVLAAEPPYNRALLTEVVAGRATSGDLRARSRAGITLYDAVAERLDLRRGIVADSNGDEHPYDHLVLATGAAPVVPMIPGLVQSAHGRPGPRLASPLARIAQGAAVLSELPGQPTGLPQGCHTIRTAADAEAVLAAATGARRVVVLGGGVLGVETAAGLAGYGTPVTLVHEGEVLLDRHLGLAAGRRVNRAVRALGVEVVLNAEAVRAETREGRSRSASSRDDAFRALRLANGTSVHGDLLVIACGVQPATSLAARAGVLLGETGGVIVDDTLTCPHDSRLHAIGDCAEIDGHCTGLVEPAWDQAAVLARRLAGSDIRYTPTPEVLRVKSPGLEVMVLGNLTANATPTPPTPHA